VGSVIPRRYLQTVFYNYPDANSADSGKACGATGFFVKHRHTFAGQKRGTTVWYAVTNDHALKRKDNGTYFPNPAIRVNVSGKAQTVPTNHNRWICDAPHDLAVLPLLESEVYSDVEFLPSDTFVGKSFLSNEGVEMGAWCCYGLGDEVFMVGRILDHDGRDANTPSIRMGNISMFPCEATDGELLIECRSIGGYSGSPVFACVTNASPPTNYRTMKRVNLLGINRGNAQANHVGNTGMTYVIPAWHILDLITSPRVIMESEKIYQQQEKEKAGKYRELDSVDARIDSAEETQRTPGREGIEIPIPTQAQVLGDFRKASRKKDK
jgi:hypothetical protein